jgi:hypothetical protein
VSGGLSRPASAARQGAGRQRNDEQFKYLQSIVARCDTLDQLMDAALTWADDRLVTPLPCPEVIKTCISVWTYRGGRKRIINHIVEAPIYARS